jgi:hypothetical protein
MEAGVEGAVAAKLEAVAQLGEADEDERQERAAVPLVIEEDVQVVEGVLVKEVALVEEEDGVDAVAAEVLHVRGDRVEDGGGGGRRREAKGDAELAVEVAPTERDVMTVGEAETGLGQARAQRAEDAGLADAGISGEEDAGALLDGVAKLVDDGLLRRGQPQVAVGDFLAEGRLAQGEVGQV